MNQHILYNVIPHDHKILHFGEIVFGKLKLYCIYKVPMIKIHEIAYTSKTPVGVKQPLVCKENLRKKMKKNNNNNNK